MALANGSGHMNKYVVYMGEILDTVACFILDISYFLKELNG